ncbi:disks large-associated protein 5-like [Centruroides vittatus]|uniref:disks large-associated protein 5-like n=1 Tax=Centruroides vittatus TaxID=120091 RepID=UPI00350EB5E6
MEGRDVNYFRQLLQNEKQFLLQLGQNWQNILDSNTEISEEISGQIRTSIGQTHLLINQRFKQFSSLIDDCEFRKGHKETTCNDLQGFWDMIYYQVMDIHEKFQKLEVLKNNNWKNLEPEEANKNKKKSVCENKIKRKALQSSTLKNHIQEARKRMNRSSKVCPVTSFNSQDKENINYFSLAPENGAIENNT